MKIKIRPIKLLNTLLLLCVIGSFNAIAQTSAEKPLDEKQLADVIENLKEIVNKNSPDKNDAKKVFKKWEKRKDLVGKTKSDVIELLYDDVKSVIKDSGIQYQIYSIFSFYKQIPIQPDENTNATTKLEAEIIALEKSGWEAWKNKNAKWFQDNTTDEAMWITSDGLSEKSQFIKDLTSCEIKSFSLDNFKLMMLDKDALVLTYTAKQDGICGGKQIPSHVRSASNYVKRGNRWLETLYMETPINTD